MTVFIRGCTSDYYVYVTNMKYVVVQLKNLIEDAPEERSKYNYITKTFK